MALPPSNTERWFLIYEIDGHQHTQMMRTTEGQTASNVIAAFDDLWTELAPVISETAIIGLDKAEANSDVRNPETWTGPPNYGTGTPPTGYAPVECSFTGRSTDGHKGRVFFFGYDGAFTNAFRFASGDVAALDAARATLSTHFGCWLAIDGQPMIFHPYTNISSNDHWVKKARVAGA